MYADLARTDVTPEWWEWAREAAEDACAAMGVHPMTYWPEDYDRGIGDDGAWIIIVEVPHTGLGWDVPPMSMWRARRTSCRSGALVIGGTPTRQQYAPWMPQQAVIATPAGDLHLWPHEYVVIGDPSAFIGEDGVEMHTLGGDPVLPDDDERLFYLMSRGIGRHDAALMLIGDIRNLDFAYFTFPDDVVAYFDGVGQPLWRYVRTHPRTDGAFTVKVDVS